MLLKAYRAVIFLLPHPGSNVIVPNGLDANSPEAATDRELSHFTETKNLD
jgi:hypothetical protein